VLKDLLASDPADGGSWLRLGLCLLRQSAAGGAPEAREALGHALKQGLDDEQVRGALGAALRSQGDVQVVVEEFRTLVQGHPDDPEAHYYLGLALAQSVQNPGARQQTGAEEHLRAAGELAPGEARYRAALANLLAEMDRPAEALPLAEAVAREAPRVARYQALLAEVYFRSGRSREALEAIDRALLLEPENRAYGEKRLLYLGGPTESKGSPAPAGPSREPVASEKSPAAAGTPTEPKAPATSEGRN